MQIQVNSGPNIEGHKSMADHFGGVVENALSRFESRITRVEVHLSDENSDKKVGHDAMRCVLEARLQGLQPIAVTHQAATLDDAVTGAAEKLSGRLESVVGRLRDQRTRRPDNDAFPESPEEDEQP